MLTRVNFPLLKMLSSRDERFGLNIRVKWRGMADISVVLSYINLVLTYLFSFHRLPKKNSAALREFFGAAIYAFLCCGSFAVAKKSNVLILSYFL